MRASLHPSALLAPARAGGLAVAAARRRRRPALTRGQARGAAGRRRRSAAARAPGARRRPTRPTRARAEAEALAARIQAAEAEITAAETRASRIVERSCAPQRARLAERQGPLVRLTAALQTLARRPPALALVQPGIGRRRGPRPLGARRHPAARSARAPPRCAPRSTAATQLRASRTRRGARWLASRSELQRPPHRARPLEARQRTRSRGLAEPGARANPTAPWRSARRRAASRSWSGTARFQAAARGAAWPRCPARCCAPAAQPARRGAPAAAYPLPVEGRLVTGIGEISDAGVHARGLTFAVDAERAGRRAGRGPRRLCRAVPQLRHGRHPRSWRRLDTVITDLAALGVARRPDASRRGAPLGRARRGEDRGHGRAAPQGRPVPIRVSFVG